MIAFWCIERLGVAGREVPVDGMLTTEVIDVIMLEEVVIVEDGKAVVELVLRVDEMDRAVSWVEETFLVLAAVVWGADNTTLNEYSVKNV